MSSVNPTLSQVDTYPATDYPENWSESLQLHHATALVNTNEAIAHVNDLTRRIVTLEMQVRRLSEQLTNVSQSPMNGGNG